MLSLAESQLGVAVEERLIQFWGDELPAAVTELREAFLELEADRDLMNYKTGSTTLSACVFLYLLARHFGPRTLCEVGTFIGRSTTALALGASRAGQSSPVLYTCDKDNECFLDERIDNCSLVPHPRTSSTAMLKALTSRGDRIDLFFFDGRLLQEDIALIRNLAHPTTVFAFDDFEGTEKGVCNVLLLQGMRSEIPLLLCPPSRRPQFMHLGVSGAHGIAVLLPAALVGFSRQ